MKLFDELNEDNFLLYAAKSYWSPTCIDSQEFFEDLKRFKYIKRLVNRYLDKGDLSERLILNHAIVIFNVFGIPNGLRMLEFRLDTRHWPVIKPFLIFLGTINNTQYTGIKLDETVVARLREI
jgi:hypothetical protein|tara:strand:- start:1311 stop:1679 length:369 start_codon:yes stop_codon:yes gene_type:complete